MQVFSISTDQIISSFVLKDGEKNVYALNEVRISWSNVNIIRLGILFRLGKVSSLCYESKIKMC